METDSPRLSWSVISTSSGLRGQYQTAFQVLAASTTESLYSKDRILWDTDVVCSSRTAHLEYDGPPLSSGQQVFWRVRLADQDGKWSDWSATASFTMGVLNASDWKAQWIGMEESAEEKPRAAPGSLEGLSWYWKAGVPAQQNAPAGAVRFKRALVLPVNHNLQEAVVLMTADDRFTLNVNGRKVGEGHSYQVLSRFDLLPFLQPGRNELQIEADNGSLSPAGLAGKIVLQTADGSTSTVAVDESWQVDAVSAGKDSNKPWVTVPPQPAERVAKVGEEPWGVPRPGTTLPPMPARMLRHEFQINQPVRRGLVTICGLGFFDLHLNGTKVGDHCMDPALTQYDHRAMYVTFDITDQLRTANNAFGVLLGNGRFRAPRLDIPVPSRSWGAPRLLLQAEISFEDGSTTRIVSDTSWKVTSQGPIRANNEYDGEHYDARLEHPGWDSPGFDDSDWSYAQTLPAPPGKLVAQTLEPMRVTERIRPLRITQTTSGSHLIDMGQAFYGNYRMRLRNGQRGTTVTIRSAYSLKPDGSLRTEDNRSARCTDHYVMSGSKMEEWYPRFRGQGYRFLEVTGYPGTPEPGDFEGRVIHTDCAPAGKFECSDELLNRIWRNIRWGQRSFLRSVPLDPDRDERQGWLGDPAKGAEGMAFNFDVSRFFSKWMTDIQLDQRPDGLIQDVVPTFWNIASGDVVWPTVAVLVPETLYEFYGDHRQLEESFPVMKRWMRFQENRLEPDFTAKPGPYGDWCDTSGMDTGATSSSLISTAYFANNCKLMARFASLLGQKVTGQHYEQLGEKVRTAFNERFLDPPTGNYGSGTQCANLLPLVFDLVPPARRTSVLESLSSEILVRHKGHPSVGLIGMQWLMQGLSELKLPEIAWTIATQKDYPSWGYMIDRGATTIWEHWDTDAQDSGMNSENLLILAGNTTGWMYRTLAGINPDPQEPGFRHIILRPTPCGDLKWVKAEYLSHAGRIAVDWQIANGRLLLKVEVPPNTSATLYMPKGTKDEVLESGQPAPSAEGVALLAPFTYGLASGQYDFSAGWDR